MRSSSGCCPRLGKPLGFQPVFACVSKSLEESLTRIFFRVFRVLRVFRGLFSWSVDFYQSEGIDGKLLVFLPDIFVLFFQ